ncbi:phenylacetic acid degradation protein PaaY [Pusillimonas sp. TS35]|uniref:phenylacetic acid degradation protein PaaY n=1 Tax=Paracandidimonas lactea TaxID=2895524 RepID=UPI001369BC5D|nr:phenylacetic acid degradation protein PaaY [Paracandidimonas lactea]MYN13401.1 phenylacetic acid degradation protein PaaY [Pusillimonas sp. TS35]
MITVYAINGVIPVVDPSAFVHPTAVLIGDVIIGPGVYVGPAACLRGDFGRIVMNAGSNVQDCCVIHGVSENDTIIEEDGHIGHGAVLHGCRIGRNAMVGMNAVVMDQADVGEESIVGAMAFVKAGMVIPARSLVMGAPAKVVRQLDDAAVARKSMGTQQYKDLAVRSLATMQATAPLPAPESGRPHIAQVLKGGAG